MNLDLDDDQAALRDTLREFFDKEAPPHVVRGAEPLGFDAALWAEVVELGLVSVAVPEERGGGGAGFVELAIAADLVGRSLAPVPLVEAAVATSPGWCRRVRSPTWWSSCGVTSWWWCSSR